ncbi:MAG: hypothetical protein CME72_11540 [Halomonadaceae bacterium]|nr:hypothetical protein [Halomonadaceae bacterium]
MMHYDRWMRVGNPWAVVEAAATDSAARDAAVSRLIDTMLELQMVRRHDSVGYQPFSVTGNLPMPGSGKAVDQAMLAAERYRPDSEWHRACSWILDQLPRRQAAAMLLQAARIRPDKLGESVWMVTARQMVERQAFLLRKIGMAERVALFDSVEALEVAARRARNKLRQWLAEEKVSAAA